MRSNWTSLLLAATLCMAPVAGFGQDAAMDMDMDSQGLLPPSPMKAALWTNKLGYKTGEQMSLYATLDRMGDDTLYRVFVYLENIETGERTYYTLTDPVARTIGAADGVVDVYGSLADAEVYASVPDLSKHRLLFGAVPTPGLWHFVAEARSPNGSQIVKRAYAKFVVSLQPEVVIGDDGTDTEISMDTTWTNDTIYRIQHQVFVNSGATLTIEPGTLILAMGQNAVIVVEKGAKIMAEGRREAPIVMTCDADVGLRESGCWAGLIVLGNAPMTRGTGLAEGVIPETRPEYGGDDPMDSSGVLRYVRVEFAGVDFNPETQPNAFGFHGVGAGTVIDHIQAHEGEDDGIEFFGGSADCTYCVSSGSKDDSLDWAFGWQGMAQYLYIQQDADGDNGIEADNDSSGFDRTPRSHPTIYNATMVGGLLQGTAHNGDGMRIRVGTAITARNVVLTGFGGDALDARDNSPGFFADGTSSIQSAIITMNGGASAADQIKGVAADLIGYMDVAPMLVNVRYEANPDPRPMGGSPALAIGNAATPPSGLDTGAQCVGAFCNDDNWLEEWTFFGYESDYDVTTTQ